MRILNCSVLITCKDKEEFLDECLNSIRRQTAQPKEVILVHDQCSEPKAHVIADTIILRDHVGVAKARQEAFRYSSGELVLFLDGDDAISPDFLEKTTLAIAEGFDIAYPDTYFWDEGGSSSLFVTPDKMDIEFVSKHKRTSLPVTCLMKRRVYEGIGGFRELPVLEDLDFWLRAMCNDCTFTKAQTLLWYRQTNATRNRIDERKKRAVLNQVLAQFKITDKEITYA